MNFDLHGKKALVGGASKGLGLACVQALAAEGCEVALVSRSSEHLQAAIHTLPPTVCTRMIVADLSTEEGVRHCIQQAKDWGSIDILVNNTGGPPPGTSLVHDDSTWQAAYESLLLYVKRMCEAFAPAMVQTGWGRIITITSRTVKEPAGNLVLSNVFRTAVTAYLKGLSTELAPHGITVNSVLPGAFRTERYEQIIDTMVTRTGKNKDEVVQSILDQLPQGRFQRPEELGALVAFLASDQASGITGTSIPVDGGALRGLL